MSGSSGNNKGEEASRIFLGGLRMSSEKTTVLKEVFRGGAARYDRYHLLLHRNKAVGFVQETAGSTEYKIFQLADSVVRLELTDGNRGKPPVLEVSRQGELLFRCVLGGRNPKPVRIGDLKYIPCQWGATSPQAVWGEGVRVEEISGDGDNPSSLNI